MNEPVSRDKEPSAFAWIFSGALGAVLGAGAWAAGRAALRRRAGTADAARPRPDDSPPNPLGDVPPPSV